MKTNLIWKRIIAFMIDLFVIGLISGIISIPISYINPDKEKYEALTKESAELIGKLTDEEITEQEYRDKVETLSYDLAYAGKIDTTINIVVTIAYFGVFAYFMQGETLGKKVFKLKIVRETKEEEEEEPKNLTIWNYLLRCLIINSVLSDIFSLIGLAFKNNFYTIYTFGSYLSSLLIIVSLIMMIARKDNRGLHDLLANTKVIDKTTLVAEPTSEVEIIKPKKKSKKEEI